MFERKPGKVDLTDKDQSKLLIPQGIKQKKKSILKTRSQGFSLEQGLPNQCNALEQA